MATTATAAKPKAAAPKTAGERLSSIEFRSAGDIWQYARTMIRVGRQIQLELEEDASRLQQILSQSTGTYFEPSVARAKAKKIAVRMRKAAHHARAMAVTGKKLLKVFQVEYAEILKNNGRNSRKQTVNWRG